MVEFEKQPASNKQLWKLNALANDVWDKTIRKEVLEHGDVKSKAETLSTTVSMPITKKQATSMISLLLEKVQLLNEHIDILERKMK